MINIYGVFIDVLLLSRFVRGGIQLSYNKMD